MKAIEKYNEKFIELLKEAEEELGGCLRITVSSRMVETPSISSSWPSTPGPKVKHYDFELSTNNEKNGFFIQ